MVQAAAVFTTLNDMFSFFVFLSAFAFFPSVTSVNRVFYIAAVDEEWNYAPKGRSVDTPQPQSFVDRYLLQGNDRIGSTYKKTLYRQYTDVTYQTEIPKPSWLGLYGPIIRAEVGDHITVHFRNNGSHDFSIHPHGLFYTKENEGAIYVDGTSGRFKFDDVVKPGTEVTLKWQVHPDDAPSEADPACIPYVYHSHVKSEVDTNTGLIGVISVCKPGTLNCQGERTDVDHEFFLVAKVFDEGASWMTSENLLKCDNPGLCKTLFDTNDPDFRESNMMYSLNGYVYGQAPVIEMCSGDIIAWHVIGMGTNIDVHSIEFHGQLVHTNMKTVDNIQVFPSIFKTGIMVAATPGNWIITCMVTDHTLGGMNLFYNIYDCGKTLPPDSGTTRHYFLSIEEDEWDYGPSGLDRYSGGSLTAPGSKSEPYFAKDHLKIGGTYKKARFHEYNTNFMTRKTKSDSSLGILGPVLRAEAGDDLEVTVKNNAKFTYNFISNGPSFSVPTSGKALTELILPGTVRMYKIHVPDDIIGHKDPDCLVKVYISERVYDVNSGLIGPLLVCRRGALDPQTGRQRYITKEFFLLFSEFDENVSYYLDDNIGMYSNPDLVDKGNPDFTNSNKMHGINGRSFGNLEGLDMCVGDNITWHIFSYGVSQSIQSPYFHGNTFSLSGTRRDVGTLVGGETHSLLMVPDNPGTWALVSAGVMLDAGVTALYTVKQCDRKLPVTQAAESDKIRIYNIGIVEVEWDFAPVERDIFTGADVNDPRGHFPSFRDDEMFIGDTYKKAIYREYTDNTFSYRKSRDDDNKHLGIMGPLIKVEVGDTIQINLKNMASREYSIHPHGVFYNKSSEGTAYNDGEDGGVQPGHIRTYMWYVPERAGPGSGDPNCIPWLYSSALEPSMDVNAGLVGAVVICRKKTLDTNNKRKDVDKEFALLFLNFEENFSWYISDNIAKHAPERVGTNFMGDSEFLYSNVMHSINGYMEDNIPGLDMKLGDTVAWYLLTANSGKEVHSVHFHGQTVTHVSKNKHRTDVIELYPGSAEEVEMRAHALGKWIIHCHVMDHAVGGMDVTFNVLE